MKGKLAWLCYDNEDIENGYPPNIRFSEPEKWMYSKVIPIVYFEVEE